MRTCMKERIGLSSLRLIHSKWGRNHLHQFERLSELHFWSNVVKRFDVVLFICFDSLIPKGGNAINVNFLRRKSFNNKRILQFPL